MPAKKKRCGTCGACQECGAQPPQIVPMPYPVPAPYPVYPRPFTPYQPRWISQPQTWGIGANASSGGSYTQTWNNGAASPFH